MSRFSLLLILILVVIVGGIILLGTVNTEVAPVRVEKAMLNEASAS
ncbi:hypothetical protein [Sphingomonas solaris]|nr:hypothetical protein [Sphingomonas solaris]